MDFMLVQMLAAIEKRQFNDETVTLQFAAQLTHQLAGGVGGTAGGDQVVADQHTLAAGNGVLMYF